jgi:hypothetical protein
VGDFIEDIGLYTMASRQSPGLLTFPLGGAKFSKGSKLRRALNVVFLTYSRYGQMEVAQDVGLYRKPFSLGPKSSARGRSIARSEKM